jgi:hypothetical protein
VPNCLDEIPEERLADSNALSARERTVERVARQLLDELAFGRQDQCCRRRHDRLLRAQRRDQQYESAHEHDEMQHLPDPIEAADNRACDPAN